MTGQELRTFRRGMGYTQDGLAKVLGVSRKKINEMENGTNGATIDKRTELVVLDEARRVRVIENTFWVEPTNRSTYAVARRLVREIDSPRAMFYSNSQLRLFGEFKRRDHAYRWCAVLQRSENALDTRELARRRAAEMADLAA